MHFQWNVRVIICAHLTSGGSNMSHFSGLLVTFMSSSNGLSNSSGASQIRWCTVKANLLLLYIGDGPTAPFSWGCLPMRFIKNSNNNIHLLSTGAVIKKTIDSEDRLLDDFALLGRTYVMILIRTDVTAISSKFPPRIVIINYLATCNFRNCLIHFCHPKSHKTR